MASLTGIFRADTDNAQENDKLVDLFKNRAELKKEFAGLREEKYQLQQRIKQHEGATARVQQKLEHIENLLLDREWVHNVVAFYQLRRLALHCAAKLGRFAEQIKQQLEQKVQSKVLGALKAEQDSKAAKIEEEIAQLRLQVQTHEDRLQKERHHLLTMSGFVRLFKGRKQQACVEEIETAIETGKARALELNSKLVSIRDVAPPDHVGLDVPTKRSINILILAFAQQLYLHFEQDGLVELAKEANEKSVGAINYGSKYECEQIMSRIDKRWDSMESVAGYADTLQKRAKLLGEGAVFRADDDVVPAPGSTATVYEITADGLVRESHANILGSNYFSIAKILSR